MLVTALPGPRILHDGSIIYFDDIYFYNGNKNKGQVRAIAEFNEGRSDRGLFLAPHLDRSSRTYLYWTEQSGEGAGLKF